MAKFGNMSKRKFGQKSPPILYGAGDKKILNTKSIAIVGSQDESINDLEFAFQLGKMACYGRD